MRYGTNEAGDRLMSATCQADGCPRPVPDNHYACPIHWARLSHITRDRLTDPGTADGFLRAEFQAQLEMRAIPPLLRGRS